MASVPRRFRQDEATRLQNAVALINRVERPKLYHDRNGRGKEYFSLKYLERSADGKCIQRTYYLGYLTEAETGLLMSAVIASLARALPQQSIVTPDFLRIRMLRGWSRRAKAEASRIARGCGMYFKGYQLRRLRTHANRPG